MSSRLGRRKMRGSPDATSCRSRRIAVRCSMPPSTSRRAAQQLSDSSSTRSTRGRMSSGTPSSSNGSSGSASRRARRIRHPVEQENFDRHRGEHHGVVAVLSGEPQHRLEQPLVILLERDVPTCLAGQELLDQASVLGCRAVALPVRSPMIVRPGVPPPPVVDRGTAVSPMIGSSGRGRFVARFRGRPVACVPPVCAHRRRVERRQPVKPAIHRPVSCGPRARGPSIDSEAGSTGSRQQNHSR